MLTVIFYIFFPISNHDKGPNTHISRLLERHGIPYHFLSTTEGSKREGEILELVQNTDFLVLARYMQVITLNDVVSDICFSS